MSLTIMAKRQADHAEDSTQGYIHEVSPIKISRANNPYFTGKIQVNTNTFQKIVCFDQSKHAELKSASAARTPIKLCDIRNVPSREDSSKIDILVNSKTTINAVRTLDFRCHNDSNSECSTKTIEEIELTPEKNQVNVIAKVLKVDPATGVEIRGQLVNKQDLIVGYATGTIKVTLWDNLVNKLNKDTTYHFQNLSTRIFNDSKFLTATKTSQMVERTAMESVATLPPIETLSKLSGRITQVAITRNIACGSCKKRININLSDSVVRCPSCSMKQKVTDTISTLLCNLNIDNIKLTVFNPQIINFLIVNNQENLKDDPDRTEDFLLNQEKISVEFGKNNVIENIQIEH